MSYKQDEIIEKNILVNLVFTGRLYKFPTTNPAVLTQLAVVAIYTYLLYTIS